MLEVRVYVSFVERCLEEWGRLVFSVCGPPKAINYTMSPEMGAYAQTALFILTSFGVT